MNFNLFEKFKKYREEKKGQFNLTGQYAEFKDKERVEKCTPIQNMALSVPYGSWSPSCEGFFYSNSVGNIYLSDKLIHFDPFEGCEYKYEGHNLKTQYLYNRLYNEKIEKKEKLCSETYDKFINALDKEKNKVEGAGQPSITDVNESEVVSLVSDTLNKEKKKRKKKTQLAS